MLSLCRYSKCHLLIIASFIRQYVYMRVGKPHMTSILSLDATTSTNQLVKNKRSNNYHTFSKSLTHLLHSWNLFKTGVNMNWCYFMRLLFSFARHTVFSVSPTNHLIGLTKPLPVPNSLNFFQNLRNDIGVWNHWTFSVMLWVVSLWLPRSAKTLYLRCLFRFLIAGATLGARTAD